MFDVGIPENNDRTMEDIVNHLEFARSLVIRLPYDSKFLQESIDLTLGYINDKLNYTATLTSIMQMAEGQDELKGFSIGSIIVDLNDAKELKECTQEIES